MNMQARARRTHLLSGRRQFGRIAAAAVVMAAVGGCERGGGQGGVAPAAGYTGIDLTGADYAKGFELLDPEGQARTLKDYAGKLVVVFFGYTQCPDVCPTTMTKLSQARELLGADADKLQGVFITVDPARDIAALLKAYTAQFGPWLVGLRGSDEQTLATAKDYKVFYRKAEGSTPQSYTMDHSSGQYVHDRQGRIRLMLRHEQTPEQVAADLKTLLAQGG